MTGKGRIAFLKGLYLKKEHPDITCIYFKYIFKLMWFCSVHLLKLVILKNNNICYVLVNNNIY